MAEDENPSGSSKEKPKGNSDSEDESNMEWIRRFFANKLNLGAPSTPKEKVIDDLSIHGLIKHWKEKGFKRIVTMVGAGISTSAGIPDFRSPGTGLYDNLQKYNLPYPMAIFDIEYFSKNPQPFFTLAKELYPGNFNPTPSHYFVRLLHEKGILQRHYTQNIDTLERVANIPEEKLVEAHGTFYTNHCLGCAKSYSKEWVKEKVFSDEVPTCTKCGNVIKPDIVFFGENLPEQFYRKPEEDFEVCDLLIVMGTSLKVYPFASLLDYAKPTTPRLVINRTNVMDLYEDETNYRDIVYLGDCDEGVWEICDGMGWTDELKKLIADETEILNKKHAESRQRRDSTEDHKENVQSERKAEEEEEEDKNSLTDK